MSQHALDVKSRLHKPVLQQDPTLETKIKMALLMAMPDTGGWFHLLRYLVWPEYLMPVYYYKLGSYEVQIERHTSYWAFIVTRPEQKFGVRPFLALGTRPDAFAGLGRKQIMRTSRAHVHRLEMHIDTAAELVALVQGTLAVMESES